jgi:hypothetical protein
MSEPGLGQDGNLLQREAASYPTDRSRVAVTNVFRVPPTIPRDVTCCHYHLRGSDSGIVSNSSEQWIRKDKEDSGHASRDLNPGSI